MGQPRPLLVFSTYHKSILIDKSVVCLGLKPGASDGRRIRIHLAMVAPRSCTVYVTLKFLSLPMCAQFLKMGPVLDHQSFCYFVPWNSILSRADIQTHNFSHNL